MFTQINNQQSNEDGPTTTTKVIRRFPRRRSVVIFIFLVAIVVLSLQYRLQYFEEEEEEINSMRGNNASTSLRLEKTNHRKNSNRTALLRSILCKQDRQRMQRLDEVMDPSQITTDLLFQTVMGPIQSGCDKLKRIGGQWYLEKGFDGGKFVCFDDLVLDDDDNGEEPCLIYSFGIGDDVSFEEAMTAYGCSIHGYDHTLPDYAKNMLERRAGGGGRGGGSLHIHRKGISAKSDLNMTSFADALRENGHSDANITYLKIDIEDSEIELFPKWLSSGLLDRVHQIGVEFHNVTVEDRVAKYFEILQGCYERGFKVISFDPNYRPGMFQGRMNFFEIVMRRVRTDCDI